MITRFEFIGLQDGETVYGHYYAKDLDAMKLWCIQNKIDKPFIAMGYLVPDNFVLDYETVAKLFEAVGVIPAVLDSLNKLFLDFMEELDDNERGDVKDSTQERVVE